MSNEKKTGKKVVQKTSVIFKPILPIMQFCSPYDAEYIHSFPFDLLLTLACLFCVKSPKECEL